MWSYEWVELTNEVELFVRYRFDETLDKMLRVYSEPLAYIVGKYQHLVPERHWDWTAFAHKPGYSTEEPVPLFLPTTNYKALRDGVEEYFRNKPDEESTVPAGTMREEGK